jgi:ribonucleotide reductase alpha subunit
MAMGTDVVTNYDVKTTSRVESELKQLDVDSRFSENALKILEKRYLMKDDDGNVVETPKDMLARVSANIAYADTFYGASYDEMLDFAKTIYTMMSNLEFLPNSPALRGAGRETQQLSACFVLPVEDSRKSIFSTLRDAVDIQAFGGGTGFNFSHIRAKGTKVESTGGAASGPLSFMQIYDMAVGKVIAQGGVRQGANMGILAYDHPDVLEFIDVKLDGKTLSNFNISVGVNEEFMDMAEKGLEYDLIDPHTKKPLKRVNARDVLDRIARNAWSTGDPGLIFLDRINQANPTPHIGVIESTNPCITGDTLVAVADGRDAVSIKQLADEGKDIPVYCRDNEGRAAIRMMRNPRLTGINKEIVKVNLDDGNCVRVTENHRFILSDGSVKQAIDLSEGDSLSIMQKMNAKLEEVYIHSNSKSQDYSWLRTTNHIKWIPEHKIIAESYIGKRLKQSQIVRPEVEIAKGKLAECQAKTDLKCFLDSGRVMVEKKCEGCGIIFYLSWSDREVCYHSPECYLNSLNYKKTNNYKSLKEESVVVNHKVVSIEFDGYENVYNGTVDEFHNFYIGGFSDKENGKTIISWIVNKNCGELPLLNWEACTLGSVNLLKMVKEKNGEYSIDYDKLAIMVKNGVHFLDNVIDMNKYPIEKIEEMTKANRKIGLGVMGWADLLSMLGIPYDSDEALELADKVMGFINTKAKEASVELAKTRGVFPNFRGCIYDTGKDEDKVRHASWTTIAPTGTLSTLSDCNGGIEPFFMVVYSRGSIYDADGKPTIKMLIENPIFKDIAIKREFYSEELMAKIAETGSVQHVDEVPEDVKRIFVTSHDIGYEWHLKTQSAFQKHVTNAVSKTINFPNSVTVEDMRNSYQLAYKLGNIKGVTVYRDGCKQNQVLSAVVGVVEAKKEEKTPEQEVEEIVTRLNAPRPRKIAGTTDRVDTPVGKLYVTVNKANGRLYEAFLNIGKAGADITADAEGYGRLLSMLFKIGVPPDMIVDQLRSIGGSGSIGFGKDRVRSLPDGIARVLERYLEENPEESNPKLNGNNGEPKMSGNMCPECGNMLVFEEGCTKCRNCGYSRC